MKNFKRGKLLIMIIITGVLFSACNNNSKTSTENGTPIINVTPEPTMIETQRSESELVSHISEDLSGNVQYISEAQFYEKITAIDNEKGLQYKGKTPAVVDFYADWCRPCIALNPVLEELAKTYKGKIIIYKVNVDKAQKLASAFGIQSIPTILFFKPNAQPGKIVGAPSKAELEKTIKEILL